MSQRTKLKDRQGFIVLAFALPAALMVSRIAHLPGADLLDGLLTFKQVPHHLRSHVEEILFVPLSAIVVSLFRLTLGLRVLGPFRPILIAVGFRAVGVIAGLVFLIVALAVITLVRPFIQRSHAFTRLSVLLSMVAILMLVPVLAGHWLGDGALGRLAYFPLIALCLTCESFATAMEKEGAKPAFLRTASTVAAALAIIAVSRIPGFLVLPLRFPELLIAQIGSVVLIEKHLNLRLLVNPRIVRAPRPATEVSVLP